MSHPMISADVAHSKHDDMLRELNSLVGQMRSQLAYERRRRRASERAALRKRLARSWHGQPHVKEHELAA